MSPQRPRGALRLNPVRRVEVVALVEYVEREVREDRARSLGHPRVRGDLLDRAGAQRHQALSTF
jgi:hypothetical protein